MHIRAGTSHLSRKLSQQPAKKLDGCGRDVLAGQQEEFLKQDLGIFPSNLHVTCRLREC